MNYEAVRETIRDGDVLAWTHTASPFRSWYDFKVFLVRLFTRSEYSHVGIAVRFGGRAFVLESVTGGIRLMPLSKFLPCYLIQDDHPFDVDRAMTVCGEPYGQLEAILGEFGRTDADNGVWQCSEFVKWAKQLPCKATPSAVVGYLLSEGCQMTEVRP